MLWSNWANSPFHTHLFITGYFGLSLFFLSVHYLFLALILAVDKKKGYQR